MREVSVAKTSQLARHRRAKRPGQTAPGAARRTTPRLAWDHAHPPPHPWSEHRVKTQDCPVRRGARLRLALEQMPLHVLAEWLRPRELRRPQDLRVAEQQPEAPLRPPHQPAPLGTAPSQLASLKHALAVPRADHRKQADSRAATLPPRRAPRSGRRRKRPPGQRAMLAWVASLPASPRAPETQPPGPVAPPAGATGPPRAAESALPGSPETWPHPRPERRTNLTAAA